ncbi:thiosulfate sulfurtransferase-like [Strongylocentrotus purpuratus]|uniref:Sulfurtransferase n=1 Tax=Strongylocentrotus purpuratus TaxID=7668 RepID=A0A7M7NVN0_STRPU|nr:thiosulfate sulfurtransferase-like [Strongylocentrotus purpuratus]
MTSSEGKVPALVSTEWLAEALRTQKTPDGRPLRVLDATYRPGPASAGRDAHDKQHIPGSLHIDLDQLRDKDTTYYYTMPTPEFFAEFVGKTLGIDKDTHVVIYENELFYKIMSAPRIWWMFRYFDHGVVSVLDGGLQQWIAENRAVTDEATPSPKPATFKVTKTRAEIFKNYDDVLQNVKEPSFQLMDSRPVDWYDGSMPSAYPGLKLGIMKMALNIPFPNVLLEDSTKFKSADDLRALFQSNGIDLSRPLTSTCFVGVTACILALGAFVVGKEDVAVFDGSWDEYSQRGPGDSMTIYEEKVKP